MQINLNSNFINLHKNSSKDAGEANLKSKNSQKIDIDEILHDMPTLPINTNDNESSLDILKKRLEKLQKRLKELSAKIASARASKNPYSREIVASLEAQKAGIITQIMQINAQLLQMQGA